MPLTCDVIGHVQQHLQLGTTQCREKKIIHINVSVKAMNSPMIRYDNHLQLDNHVLLAFL
jgi:hypothetical protein